jgi:tetratricopeptide (TPR) repeat protein
MSSNNKNSTQNSTKKISPKPKAADGVFKPTYLELWNRGITCGLISKERKSKPEYYHMVYRRSLEVGLNQYEEADEKVRIELAKKFETNLANECLKLELWHQGMRTGLIDEKWPPVCDERNYYTTFPLKELQEAITAYDNAYEENKDDVPTFDKMAEAFSQRLQKGPPPKVVPTTNHIKTVAPTTSKSVVITSVRIPNSDTPAGINWAALAGKGNTTSSSSTTSSGSSTETKTVPSKVDSRKPRKVEHQTDEEYSDASVALIAMWREGLDMGLIASKNRFHRGIPSFITLSELKSLLTQYFAAEKDEKREIYTLFNQELTNFNDIIPSISRSFKVIRTYAEVWREADAVGIIPREYEYSVDFAEWLPVKDLVSYIQAIATMIHRKERHAIREAVSTTILERLQNAECILSFRKKLAVMSTSDLVDYSVQKRISSRDVIYNGCETCVPHLDRTDLISALSSWMYDGDEDIAKARYLRWHSHRKFIHSHNCVN